MFNQKIFIMRRVLLSIFMAMSLVIIPEIVESQEKNFGIKGGLTLSNLYIDVENLDTEDRRIGFNAGIFGQFMFKEKIGIQPEFLYTTKGSEADYLGVIDQTVSFNINYLDIPVLFVLRPVEILDIYAGPYAGVLLNSNIGFEGTIEGETDLDRDHFRSLDAGLIGGIALNFGGFKLGARYNLGLLDIADSDASELLLGDSKNQYAQFYLAIQFPARAPRY